MRIRRIARLAAFVSALATAPFSGASAQYYAPCSPFPLVWPFCAAGAIVGTAANIATAPFWLTAGAPPPLYPAPGYYYPGVLPTAATLLLRATINARK
jgi:hypothetical protein